LPQQGEKKGILATEGGGRRGKAASRKAKSGKMGAGKRVFSRVRERSRHWKGKKVRNCWRMLKKKKKKPKKSFLQNSTGGGKQDENQTRRFLEEGRGRYVNEGKG